MRIEVRRAGGLTRASRELTWRGERRDEVNRSR
jgi:hypothetical protein